MLKQISAGVVVYREFENHTRHYLLLQYPGKYWDFPKGKLKDGETWRQGAKRELAEETGLTIILHERFEHSYSYTFSDNRGNKIEKTIVFLLSKAPFDSEISLSQEHVDYLWLPYQQARMQLPFENIKHLLDQVDQFLDLSIF